jgi:hypothetical protein
MAEITSGLLKAELDKINIDEAFNLVRSNINGIISLASMGSAERPYEGYKFGWLEEQDVETSSPLTAPSLAASTTLSVADGTKFRKGMMISSKGEIMIVTAVAANDLTVVRGVGGTTAVDQAANDVIMIDSVAREENSLVETDGIFQPYEVENFFQTMDTAIEMSRRSLATLQEGNTNDLSYQLGRRIQKLGDQMNRAFYRGRKHAETIDGKLRTYSGGIKYFLDQAGSINVDHSAASLTLDAIDELNKEVVLKGGMTDTIVVSVNKAKAINALVRAEYSSQSLNSFLDDRGSLVRLTSSIPLIGNINQIVVDTNLADDELFIADTSKFVIKPMAQGNAEASGAWRTVDATQNGQDGQVARVIGDFGFQIRDSKTHMAGLYNIA